MLSIMLIQIIPIKKMSNASLFFEVVLLNLNSKYPTSRFANAHITFVSGDDNPFPGGSENGDGKGFPETPLIK